MSLVFKICVRFTRWRTERINHSGGGGVGSISLKMSTLTVKIFENFKLDILKMLKVIFNVR